MKTTINILLVCVLALFITQCEVVSEDLLQSPNNPSPENVSPDFLLNNIQLSTADFFENVEGEAGETVRMYQLAGSSYDNAYQPQFLDSEWEDAYAEILEDVQTLIPIATDRQLFSHVGIARVLRAYTLVALVDKFGDIPLSEALDETNFNPAVDTGAEVYAAAFADLDSAKVAFNMDEAALPANDVYYGSASDRDAAWITLANTLQLKILFQQRLVSDNAGAINALLDGDVIDEPGEEFAFPYSNNQTNPDSRHPDFGGNYTSTGTALGNYIPVYYMNELFNDKNENLDEAGDPRIRYYLYRQVADVTDDPNEQDCINNSPPLHYSGVQGNGINGNDPYCEDWNEVGYWGRDHGNDDGIPPDTQLRTTYGVYPAGGRYDANQAEAVADDQGLQGAGIQPMWMPFFTDFVRAEVELTINGNPAAAGMALENAVRSSISFVMDFSGAAVAMEDTTGIDDPADDVDNYVAEVLSRYAAADNTGKLNVIAKEFYLALWGNGLDAYNLYRRVAPEQNAPNWDLQPLLEDPAGTFVRSFVYPSNLVQRNSSVEQKPGPGVQVFWDTNPAGFANF